MVLVGKLVKPPGCGPGERGFESHLAPQKLKPQIIMEKTLSNNDVANVVENEGLGYAVMHYMDSSNIQNKELAELWDKAEEACTNLEEYLKENSHYNG